MNFLFPSVLWALTLLSIPVIVHLFNFRIYKTAYFSNLKFLNEIRNVSESKSKIKQIIVLIIRVLAFFSLILAFAGPYHPIKKENNSQKNKIVAIYIDNSFSMNAGSSHGNMLDAAKERARKIVNSYSNSQKFLFLSNDFEGKHRMLAGKEQVIKFINEIEPSRLAIKLSEMYAYLNNYLNENHAGHQFQVAFYIVSDFQRVTSDVMDLKTDSAAMLYLVPMATNQYSNLIIDSCWFTTPARSFNKQEELVVKIRNIGPDSYSDIPIKLVLNGRQKAVSSVDIEGNRAIDIPIKYTNTEKGISACFLEISDYPVTFDNRLFFTYEINEKTSILIISGNGSNKYINSLFKADSSFVVQQATFGNVKLSEIDNYQVIVLDGPENIPSGMAESLKRFVSKGGVISFIPSQKSLNSNINQFIGSIGGIPYYEFVNQESVIEKINFNHFIYNDVFIKTEEKLKLPELKTYFSCLPKSNPQFNVLLASMAGKPLLVHHNYQKGKVFVFYFRLETDNSNFVLHPLFVPTLYNIAAFSQMDERLYYTAGLDDVIDVNFIQSTENQNLRIVNHSKTVDFIPAVVGMGELGTRLNLMKSIDVADNYFIEESGKQIKGISFNYNRFESDSRVYTSNELNAIIDSCGYKNCRLISAETSEFELQLRDLQKDRIDLWKVFIVLAFAFLLAEMLILKFWKESKNKFLIDGISR